MYSDSVYVSIKGYFIAKNDNVHYIILHSQHKDTFHSFVSHTNCQIRWHEFMFPMKAHFIGHVLSFILDISMYLSCVMGKNKSVEGTKAIPRLIKQFHHVCSCWHEERITRFSQSVRLSGTVHVRLPCNSMLKNCLYSHKMTFTQLCMELRKCQNTLAEHREPEECHRKIHWLKGEMKIQSSVVSDLIDFHCLEKQKVLHVWNIKMASKLWLISLRWSWWGPGFSLECEKDSLIRRLS